MNYAESRAGYANLLRATRIRPERRAAAMRVAAVALTHRERYEAVALPGMPWWWVAAVHSLESGADWATHLHNGDPLARRTVHVPAGRPLAGGPPYTWEESARDALLMHHLDSVPTWGVERCLYEWERYNGFGYVSRGVNSPYLWAGTTQYSVGKYTADGRFSATAVSGQIGAVAIMLAVNGERGIAIDRSLIPAPRAAATGFIEVIRRWFL